MRKNAFLWYWLPFLSYCLLVFIVSSRSLSDMDLGRFFMLDKVLHALEFSIFAVLCYRAFAYGVKNYVMSGYALSLSLLVSFLYAISDEYHQSFVPHRQTDLSDLVADVMGIVVACLLIYFKKSKQECNGKIE